MGGAEWNTLPTPWPTKCSKTPQSYSIVASLWWIHSFTTITLECRKVEFLLKSKFTEHWNHENELTTKIKLVVMYRWRRRSSSSTSGIRPSKPNWQWSGCSQVQHLAHTWRLLHLEIPQWLVHLWTLSIKTVKNLQNLAWQQQQPYTRIATKQQQVSHNFAVNFVNFAVNLCFYDQDKNN